MEEGSISDPVVRSVLGVRLKVALVRVRHGHAAEVVANQHLVDRHVSTTGRMAPPPDRLARCQRAANSSGYANLSIKEGIGSVSAVRKPGRACSHSLGSRNLATTKNPDLRLSLLDLAETG